MQEKETIRLFAFPLKLKTPNAYWDNLYGEILKDKRIEAYHNDFKSLLFSFKRRQVIHIHWQNILYASRYRWFVPIKLVINLFILIVSKMRGDRLVWTMHNYRDHEIKHRLAESVALSFLIKRADAILVHSLAGQEYLLKEYDRKDGVYVVPHGNYIDFYGPRLERPDVELQKLLGVNNSDKVFLSLGSIRPYKGLEELIDLFNQLPRNYKLVIAGRVFYNDHFTELEKRVKNGNIIFYNKLIPNDDIPKFFSIADFSLFNFKEVLTSGSVILSLSYGVPPIVPKIGDLKYLIEDGINGFVFDGGRSLEATIDEATKMSEVDRKEMAKTAIDKIRKIKYNDLAKKTLIAYNIK